MVKSTKEIADWVYHPCDRCGAVMNPAERMIGPVCGKCVRTLHRRAVGLSGYDNDTLYETEEFE